MDDTSTIISPISAPPKGRWKRQFLDALSVRWFGAKGNMKGAEGHYKGTVLKSMNILNISKPRFEKEDEGKTICLVPFTLDPETKVL